MAVLKNRVGVATSTTGTGTITLGAALTSAITPNAANWQTFAGGGVANGDSVRYLILDSNGAWEYGPGVYTAAGTALSRAAGLMDGSVPGQKSSSGSLISLTGTAHVFITAVAEDLPPNLAASKLLGRGSASGAGPGEEITLGTGLSMSGATLSAASSGGGLLNVQTFTTAGANTYTPTPGMVNCIIECVGAGGGGGGTGTSTGNSVGGAGGGSGAYSRAFKTAAQVGASQNVTVGAKGTGSGNANGTTGGDSFVGANLAASLCGAKGGLGGELCNNTTNIPAGGAGGAAASGVGDVKAGGAPGVGGFYNAASDTNIASGAGGSSFFGGGATGRGVPGTNGLAGIAATPYGSGGSGAVSFNTSTSYAGGAGSDGIVVITEYK